MPATWDELEVGAEHPPMVDAPLTVTDFVRYQGAAGDLNPIHHDGEIARRAGFPSVFAVGMLQAGILATYATDWLGPANVRHFKVRFCEQAWPGDVITYSGRVSAKREERGRHLVDVDLKAARQTGGIHILGWATFDVDRQD